MKKQYAPTKLVRRKLLIAGVGITTASLIPLVLTASQSFRPIHPNNPVKALPFPGILR